MKLVSFDIGLKTCSVAVEEYKVNFEALSVELQPPTSKYITGGEATPEMKEYVKQVARLGRVIKLEKKELGDKKAYFSGHAFRNLYAWCQDLAEHLSTADVILIEQQMKCNNIALALMYHLQAWIMIQYPDIQVILYPSKNKTRILGAPLKIKDDANGKLKKVTKYQRKVWSTVCAKEILLELRQDEEWHQYIFVQNKSKKDDLSDVIMQALSYVVGKLCKNKDF